MPNKKVYMSNFEFKLSIDYIILIVSDISKNIESTKRLGRPLNRIEKFKLSWTKKDDDPVNAAAVDFLVSFSFLKKKTLLKTYWFQVKALIDHIKFCM